MTVVGLSNQEKVATGMYAFFVETSLGGGGFIMGLIEFLFLSVRYLENRYMYLGPDIVEPVSWKLYQEL